MNMKPEKIIPPEDEFVIRCPRLGHQIPFSYCLHESGKLPCFKILDCWHNYFQVEKYLKETLTTEEWENTFFTSGQPKILTLIELIQQVKNSKKEKYK